MKKVFVAGHNGMVGQAICRKLKDEPKIETITYQGVNWIYVIRRPCRYF